MLKADAKKKLKAIGLDLEKLISAATHAEEQDFDVPEINNLTEDQLTERDKQVVAAAKPELLAEGKRTGIEIANKQIIKKFGIDVKEIGEPDKVITALEAKFASGDEGLKEQVKLLQADKTRLETDLVNEQGRVKGIEFDTELTQYFPPNRAATMNDKEYLMLTKSALEFEEVDGARVVKRNGEIVRHPQTKAPLPIKEVVGSLFNERKWVAQQQGGGRGGDDNTGGGGGIKKFSQAQEQWVKDNPTGNPISPQFMDYVGALAKADSAFDMDA